MSEKNEVQRQKQYIVTAGCYSSYQILGTVTGPPLTTEKLEAFAREWWPQRDKQASKDRDFFEWFLRSHPEYAEVEVEEVHAWDYAHEAYVFPDQPKASTAPTPCRHELSFRQDKVVTCNQCGMIVPNEMLAPEDRR